MKTSAADAATLAAWLVADPIWLPDSSCSVAGAGGAGQGDRAMVGDQHEDVSAVRSWWLVLGRR